MSLFNHRFLLRVALDLGGVVVAGLLKPLPRLHQIKLDNG